MPNFYNFLQDGLSYSFDDVFVPADAFRQGNLFAWGFNSSGQLGDNNNIWKNTPVTTLSGGNNWKQVYYSNKSASGCCAAIKTDGTLWTWGSNSRGQLGINLFGSSRSIPVTTFAGGTNWKQVSLGNYPSAAIKTDGTLWTWGLNDFGVLGDNTVTQRLAPVTTFAGGTNWKQVACGGFHIAAIKTDGTLWTWGRNNFGQLGNNTVSNSGVPITTFAGGNNWKQVSSGGSYTVAIKTDGTLWTWGINTSGELGDNTIISRSTPVTTLAGGTTWKQVSCGESHTAAIKTDGTLWTWGINTDGRLGNNISGFNISTPITTFAGGTNWKQVSSGSQFTAAIKTDGTLWTWGDNGSGQLGDNTFATKNTPVTTFAGITNWKQVATGNAFTAATTYIDDYQ